MAIFVITNKKSSATIEPVADSFAISTLAGIRCARAQTFQRVDNLAYTSPNLIALTGYTVWSDSGLTTLYNTTGLQKDYNINNGLFITLDKDSKHIQNPC